MYKLNINTDAYNIGLLIANFEKNINRKITENLEKLHKQIKQIFKNHPQFEMTAPWTY